MSTPANKAAQREGARTQGLFREVNERIEEMLEGSTRPEFLCECANDACTAAIEMTLEEYEVVRSDPRRFPVALGHEVPEIERVAEENERFLVVEKFGVGGDIAERLDPRRRNGRAHNDGVGR